MVKLYDYETNLPLCCYQALIADFSGFMEISLKFADKYKRCYFTGDFFLIPNYVDLSGHA